MHAMLNQQSICGPLWGKKSDVADLETLEEKTFNVVQITLEPSSLTNKRPDCST